MTTTQQSQSTHLRHLVSALGPMTTNAILGLVDEEVKRLTEVSNEIVAQQRGVIKDAAATNDVKAVKAANQATPVVKEAAKAVEQAAESGNPDDAAKAKAKVTEAKEAVSEAEVAVRKALEQRHEAILAVKHEGTRPPSRLDALEARTDALGSQLTEDRTRALQAARQAAQEEIARSVPAAVSGWKWGFAALAVSVPITIVRAVLTGGSLIVGLLLAIGLATGVTIMVTLARSGGKKEGTTGGVGSLFPSRNPTYTAYTPERRPSSRG